MAFRLCYPKIPTCQRCEKPLNSNMLTLEKSRFPQTRIYCSKCDINIDYFKCHGTRKDGSRCRSLFNITIKPFRGLKYCLLHSQTKEGLCQTLQEGSYCTIVLLSSNKCGIFISLEKAKEFTKYLQRTHNNLVMITFNTGYKKEHYLTKNLSPLKVISLIDLINEFIGKDRVWILDKSLTIVDFDYMCKNDEIKYLVKINKPFKL